MSGGVGSFAVQFAAGLGARVLAVASARHHPLLAELGAQACVDYTAEDVGEAVARSAGREVDAIADFVGSGALAASLALLRERGVEIVDLDGDLEELIDRNQELHGVLFNPANAEPLRAVAAELEAGRVRPVVSECCRSRRWRRRIGCSRPDTARGSWC